MERLCLPHLPGRPLTVCLFTDVDNAVFLRGQLLAGNPDFEYAFLDASVLLSRKHVLVACWRAINDADHRRLRTRNVHSEIVFALSPHNNITDSFRRFGIQDGTKNVLAIKVGGDAHLVETHWREAVHGTAVSWTDQNLARLTDHSRLRKAYKLAAPAQGISDVEARERAEAFVLGSIALKAS